MSLHPIRSLRHTHILKKPDRAGLCNPITGHDGSLLPLPAGERERTVPVAPTVIIRTDAATSVFVQTVCGSDVRIP
jgi:hypothetical protein